MSIAIPTFVTKVQQTLNDEGADDWTVTHIVHALNDAIRAVIRAMPSARYVREEFTCALGAIQALPDEAVDFIGIDGVTMGGIVTCGLSEEGLSDLNVDNPGWWSASSTETPRGFVFEKNKPYQFLMYPPVAAGVTIQIVYSEFPPLVTYDEGTEEYGADTLDLHEKWEAALFLFVMARAMARPGTDDAMRKSMQYQSEFYSTLGLPDQAKMSLSAMRAVE